MLRSPRDDQVMNLQRAGPFENTRYFIERAAGRHHVIDDEDVLPADASFDCKRAANIAPPLAQRESLLSRGVPDAE